ncbi:MAG TPA: nuclear transport factor 2 family protein [Gammaproteobacteria bacterium]|nr:nuclear transport factor 2 family protein [Gammaproteobacteria bacterium]
MSTRTFAGALTVAALLALPASSPAQKPMELTALDYIEIQQLVAKYARAIDTCSNNGYDYADLYTPDGVFLPIVAGKPLPGIQGREKLAEVSGGGAKGCKNVPWIEQGVHHIYVNHIITPTPDGATGTVDMMMIGLGGDPNKIESDGYYEDVYVKTARGWRFKQRTHHAELDAGRRVTPPPVGSAPPSNSKR